LLFLVFLKTNSFFQSFERDSSKNSRRYSDHDRHSSNYEPPRKRYPHKHQTDDHQRRIFSNNENNYR